MIPWTDVLNPRLTRPNLHSICNSTTPSPSDSMIIHPGCWRWMDELPLLKTSRLLGLILAPWNRLSPASCRLYPELRLLNQCLTPLCHLLSRARNRGPTNGSAIRKLFTTSSGGLIMPLFADKGRCCATFHLLGFPIPTILSAT